jgi:GWxTD domain-containing protein
MRERAFFLVVVFLSLHAPALSLGSAYGQLPPQYQKWLNDEAVYIITPLEQEVFLKLTSDRERDLFIEAFWKHRDQTPASPENEFKTEHYRRISSANQFFGREAAKPGWRTDRGRIYIILGEPNDVQRFEAQSQTHPAEVWFYQDKVQLGLPAGFSLLFFQPGGVGEFKLYSPTRDGPQALLTSYLGDPIDYAGAYRMLMEAEPSLANVSLSLVPGEDAAAMGRPSLSSDILIQLVETTAQRQVEEMYARKFVEYKDRVEVEYSANYMDSDSLVTVVRDASGIDFIHLSIEPKRLSVGQVGKKFYTTLRLNGLVATMEGKTVFQFDRTISLDFDEEKMAAASRRPLNIHDIFPLIPGRYRISILLKNEVSKEFSSLEQTLSVPAADSGIRMTLPMLAYRVVKAEDKQDQPRPFRLGPHQLYCQPNRVFAREDKLFLAFQVNGLGPETEEKAEMRYVIQKDDQALRSFTRKVTEYKELPNIVEEIPLADFEPAHYRVQAALSLDGREVVQAADEFDVTHLEAVNRPWIHSRLLPSSSDPFYDDVIGTQLYNTGRTDDAISHLEKAVQARPDSADYAQNLARAYMTKGEHQKVEPLLLWFFQLDKPPAYDLYLLLGRAYQKLGEWDKAIDIFNDAVSRFGVGAVLLNAVGACYLEKGDSKAALVAWKKSLELNPDQPQVRKSVEAIRGNK